MKRKSKVDWGFYNPSESEFRENLEDKPYNFRKITKEDVDRVYMFMLDKIGEEFAVKSNQIANRCGIPQSRGDYHIRSIIYQVCKDKGLPIVSSSMGYFIAKDPMELMTYLNSLESRIESIIYRKSVVLNAFKKYYEPLT